MRPRSTWSSFPPRQTTIERSGRIKHSASMRRVFASLGIAPPLSPELEASDHPGRWWFGQSATPKARRWRWSSPLPLLPSICPGSMSLSGSGPPGWSVDSVLSLMLRSTMVSCSLHGTTSIATHFLVRWKSERVLGNGVIPDRIKRHVSDRGDYPKAQTPNSI
jgi:hypothetical protein